MNRSVSLIVMLAITPMLSAWQGTESHGDKAIFSGVLTSQEENGFYLTNITVGRSSSSRDKITLYEMPKDLKQKAQGQQLSVNPTEELTTAQMELMKIKKLEIPSPRVMWTWKDPDKEDRIAREFIEIVVTWRSGRPVHYLLELGPEDTQRPLKVFGDAVDKPLKGIRQDGTLFCANIDKKDLHKKGAPFPSIKSLVLDEPCFKLPTDETTKKNH